MKIKLLIGILFLGLILISGCYMTEEEASDWEWDGRLSSLDRCYYSYVVASENNAGWGYKGKSIMADDKMNFPAPCEDVYNWCSDNWQEDSKYSNRNVDKCSWEIRHSYSCRGRLCDLNKWRVNPSGSCICTFDELEETENWFKLKGEVSYDGKVQKEN